MNDQFKKDGGEDDPGAASRGNWWQGMEFYFFCSLFDRGTYICCHGFELTLPLVFQSLSITKVPRSANYSYIK